MLILFTLSMPTILIFSSLGLFNICNVPPIESSVLPMKTDLRFEQFCIEILPLILFKFDSEFRSVIVSN